MSESNKTGQKKSVVYSYVKVNGKWLELYEKEPDFDANGNIKSKMSECVKYGHFINIVAENNLLDRFLSLGISSIWLDWEFHESNNWILIGAGRAKARIL